MMNFITYDRAYCLFPRATIIEKIGVVTNYSGAPREKAAIEKYSERCWTMIYGRNELEKGLIWRVVPPGMHKIGDHTSWVIPLSTPPHIKLFSSRVRSESWRLKYGSRWVVLNSYQDV